MADTNANAQTQEKFRRLESLIQQAEKSSNPETRARVKEVVQVLMDLHGSGLERIMECVAATGQAGMALIDSFAKDPLLNSLLLLYDLHPLDLDARIQQALEKARPLLRAHGGDVEMLSLKEGIVRLRLLGSCHGCPSSSVTLRQTIEEAVLEFAPDAAGIEVMGEDRAPMANAEEAPLLSEPAGHRVALPILSA